MRFARMIRHLLLSLALGVSVASAITPAAVWRVVRFANSDAQATADSQLVLSSAEISGDRLVLRVGVQGLFGRPGFLKTPTLTESDVSLKVNGEARTLACISMDKSWDAGVEMNMMPGEILMATLVFHAPAGLAEKLLFLRVGGYAHIAFRCMDGTPLALPDLSHTPERWEIDAQVDANVPALNPIRLELGTARVWDGKLTIGMSFRNAGRFPFRMNGGPSGGEAILVNSEREYFRKPSVVGAFVEHIAPASDWRPDQTVTGTVTFPMPHLHGAGRLWLAFPGFPAVPLVFDGGLHHWRAEKENMVPRGVSMVQLRAKAEQELYESVCAFWESFSRKLEGRQFSACGALFDKPEECGLLRHIEKVPLGSAEVRPAAEQRLMMSEDGSLRLRMEFRYRFRGQPKENQFILIGGCRMRRVTEPPGWRVDSLVLDLAPPWAQGYTAFGESKHFLIFFRPEGGQVTEAMSTLEQLEESWSAIAATGLTLADKYAAFLCLNDDDHKMLTGDLSMGMADASVGSIAWVENDVFQTYNLAVFVSRDVFAGPSAMQKRRRLQIALDHEMVHAALSQWTRSWMPGWLVEGAAVYLSGEKRSPNAPLAEAMATGLSLRGISESSVLRDAKGDLRRIDLQYKLAAETVAFIDMHWGTAKLLELYRAFSLEYPEQWHGPYGIDYEDEHSEAKRRARIDLTQRLLRRVLGVGIEDLEAVVRTRLRR